MHETLASLLDVSDLDEATVSAFDVHSHARQPLIACDLLALTLIVVRLHLLNDRGLVDVLLNNLNADY